ncbi:LysR substrate-binding domain-containing protein [Solimonas sp. K1W22B-7]|uniref:LysR substrate-binding domain-containing protein n=1 Tax=Solimonas sp. K1W22B-7 TaxID=2303331 RepID=UPI0013C43344|nr:LysR substrate-binding domain-containing protein [Solimonas sp. K1W22B-7]
MSSARLPPLNALRAFEAVARHRSFRKAAEELFVTPAAVTHQIKALEEQLGVDLFRRLPRRIELTPAAAAALPLFERAFGLIARGVSELRDYDRAPHLTVRATPTFASRWMMPRLHNFLAVHQGIDVRVLASANVLRAPATSADEGAESSMDPDIDIVFSSERPETEHADLLFRIDIVPMCHPRLLKDGPHPLKTPDDLRYHALLHGDTHIEDRSRSGWAQWLRQAGVTNVDPRRGLQFDHSTLALDAAGDGLGVTLATPMFASDELKRGDVAVAFSLAITLDRAYWAVTAAGSAGRPEVAAFRQWLLQEAALDAEKALRATKKKRPRGGSRPE